MRPAAAAADLAGGFSGGTPGGVARFELPAGSTASQSSMSLASLTGRRAFRYLLYFVGKVSHES